MKKLLILFVCVMLSSCAVQPNRPEVTQTPESAPEETPESTEIPAVIETVDFVLNERDEFQTVWTMAVDQVSYQRTVENGDHFIRIESWSDASKPLTLSSYGIALEKGVSYTISMEVSGDVSSSLQIEICNYEGALYSQSFEVSEQKQRHVFSFTMNEDSFWDGKIVLKFLRSEKESGEIQLTDLKMTSSKELISVKVNQLGYSPEDRKTAVFVYNSGDVFHVINTKTNEVVYTGLITGKTENTASGEINYVGDFSSVIEPGTYRIESQMLSKSYEFEIREDIYSSLLKDSLYALSLQRCGQDLTENVFGTLAHEACHDEKAISVVNNELVDVGA